MMLRNLGDVFKKAIKDHNMTQNEVAEKLNISPQVLSNYVNNKRTPHLECFFDLIDLLDLKDVFYNPPVLDHEYIDTYLRDSLDYLTFEQKQVLYLFVRLLAKK